MVTFKSSPTDGNLAHFKRPPEGRDSTSSLSPSLHCLDNPYWEIPLYRWLKSHLPGTLSLFGMPSQTESVFSVFSPSWSVPGLPHKSYVLTCNYPCNCPLSMDPGASGDTGSYLYHRASILKLLALRTPSEILKSQRLHRCLASVGSIC